MRKIIYLVAVAVLVYGLNEELGLSIPGLSTQPSTRSADTGSAISRAYEDRQSDIQIKGEGVVVKTLADDLKGSRHQKFLLKVESGQTLLVAHNIDLAPRINSLREGDNVAFYGEYEWNEKGGVIHWTHHDPAGRHTDGWLKHQGRLYQ